MSSRSSARTTASSTFARSPHSHAALREGHLEQQVAHPAGPLPAGGSEEVDFGTDGHEEIRSRDERVGQRGPAARRRRAQGFLDGVSGFARRRRVEVVPTREARPGHGVGGRGVTVGLAFPAAQLRDAVPKPDPLLVGDLFQEEPRLLALGGWTVRTTRTTARPAAAWPRRARSRGSGRRGRGGGGRRRGRAGRRPRRRGRRGAATFFRSASVSVGRGRSWAWNQPSSTRSRKRGTPLPSRAVSDRRNCCIARSTSASAVTSVPRDSSRARRDRRSRWPTPSASSRASVRAVGTRKQKISVFSPWSQRRRASSRTSWSFGWRWSSRFSLPVPVAGQLLEDPEQPLVVARRRGLGCPRALPALPEGRVAAGQVHAERGAVLAPRSCRRRPSSAGTGPVRRAAGCRHRGRGGGGAGPAGWGRRPRPGIRGR